MTENNPNPDVPEVPDMEMAYVPQHMAVPEKVGFFSQSAYDTVKFLAMIAFPALGVAYFSLAQIWGLPKAEEVVGTITVIDLFLGTLVGISKRQYDNSEEKYDGAINVTPNEDGNSDLNVALNPASIAGKDEILVKVVK